MNSFLKSAFISIFPLFGLEVALLGVYSLLENGFDYPSIGRVISGFTVATFFAGLFIFQRARTSVTLKPYSLLIALGTLLTIQQSTHDFWLYVSSILLIIGWLLYLYWYSKFEGRESSILKLENQIPIFELEKADGQKVSNSIFLGNPTIYLFYRGNWCPLCMAQIKEVANQYIELESMGVQMVFVSPQPHKKSQKLAKKFDLGFHYLQDTNNKVARNLGIHSKAGIPLGFQFFGYDSETVMPTVVITDRKGVIRFLDLTDNYRVRPEPSTFFKVIREMN